MRRTTRAALAAEPEAQRLLQNLAARPTHRTTAPRDVLKQLLLLTDGWLMCWGESRTIKNKPIGAGVYEIWTEPRT